MSIKATQRNATRNQSTVDFQRANVFTYGNRYRKVSFKNNTAGELVVDNGLLLIRDAADSTKVIPAVAGATLANMVGILNAGPSAITLAAGESVNTYMAISGNVDGGLVTLPDTVTYDTLINGVTVKDKLTGLGFVVENVSENTKFDN